MASLDLSLPHGHEYLRDSPSLSYAQNRGDGLCAPLVRIIEHLMGQPRVEAIYHELKREDLPLRDFYRRVLEITGISVAVNDDDVARIPTDGPLVVVANHPFGVVDGVVLCDLATRVRGDFKILIHSMLCQDKDFSSQFLPIDFDENETATQNNIRTKRVAREYLDDGGTLLVFPGGEVATADRRGFGSSTEAPWSTFAAKLIKQTGATVVPVFFDGHNSRLFHIASHLNINLRTGMLIAEVLRSFGTTVRVNVGRPLPFSMLEQFDNRTELTHYLYQQTMALGLRNDGARAS